MMNGFCNPAAGWEKGQVKKNVRDSRHQMLQGMPDFPDLVALNACLEQRCMELWRETAHGTLPGAIADVWAEEQATLMPLPVAFEGIVELSKRVSPTCLISFEHEEGQETVQWTVSPTQGYSVPASFANRPVSLRIYPDRLFFVLEARLWRDAAEGNILCEHARIIQPSHHLPPRTIYDWRHYLAPRHCPRTNGGQRLDATQAGSPPERRAVPGITLFFQIFAGSCAA